MATFAERPEPGRFRLLIEEFERIGASAALESCGVPQQPARLVYAETFELDPTLTG